MKITNKKRATIDPKEWYTMQEIVRAKMFPWATSFWSIRNMVALDRRNKNLLKINISGTGKATRYFFLGANIIKFKKEFEAGKIRL